MAFIIRYDAVSDGAEIGRRFDKIPLYGIERAMGIDDTLPDAEDGSKLLLVKFKMYDDDGELYYEGELHDDADCMNQSAALRWGESNAGCTTIKVFREGSESGDRWIQEIG